MQTSTFACSCTIDRSLMLCIRFVLVVSFVSFVLAYNNEAPNSLLPPLGWSSWVALGPGADHPIFDFCDEFSVKAAADAFIEVGLFDAGYRHFHLDDCWAGGRNESGFLYPDTEHFPNGMAPVVDYVHSKHLTFGLYTCAGTETCVGHRPGSKDHWQQDAAVWAEWGVDWVKQDWCNTEGMDIQQSYHAMSSALNATGRRIHFNMCEWGKESPWKWGDNLSQSWRMSGDHTGNWDSTQSIISQSAAIPPEYSGRPYGWNDMDMLETGCRGQCAKANDRPQNMTDDEFKTEFSMWAISASPLIFTAPIMNCTSLPDGSVSCKGWISDLQKEILLNTEVIAINQDTTPQGSPLNSSDITRWTRRLSDGSVAFAIYNPSASPLQPGQLLFSALGWAHGTNAKVRDLWKHEDLGVFTDSFQCEDIVAPHATRLFRLWPGLAFSDIER